MRAVPFPRRYLKVVVIVVALMGIVCLISFLSPVPPPPLLPPTPEDLRLEDTTDTDVLSTPETAADDVAPTKDNSNPFLSSQAVVGHGAHGTFDAIPIWSGIEGGAAARIDEASLPDNTEEAFKPEPMKKETIDNEPISQLQPLGDDHAPDQLDHSHSNIAQLRQALSGLRDVLGSYGSCAVVGESTSLYTGPRLYTDEIDRHDAVFRLPVAEGMPWYTHRQASFKGTKATLEVHYSGNKTWQGVPGVHTLCGAHGDAPILLMPNDYGMDRLNALATPCADNVAKRLVYVTPGEADALFELHETLNVAVPWNQSALLFTEEWLATYVALALCDKVELFGIITETEAYVYGHEGTNEGAAVLNPLHWEHALARLEIRDTAYYMLSLSTRKDKVHQILPAAYTAPFKRRLDKLKERLYSILRAKGLPTPWANKSCIVMGAAPNTKGRKLGEWIDGHDSVWRCNQHVPEPDNEEQTVDLGQRSDVIVTVSQNVHDELVASTIRRARDEQNTAVILYPRPASPDLVPALYDLHPQSDYSYVDQFTEKAVYSWLKGLSPSTQSNGWFYHSTGHFAVNLAVFSCASISVAGFGIGRLTLYHHGFVLEAMLLELYDQAGIIHLDMPDNVRHRLRAYLHNMHKSGVLKRI